MRTKGAAKRPPLSRDLRAAYGATMLPETFFL